MDKRPSTRKSRTQVFLITGFLGSGKTTLLNSLIRSQEDLSGTVVLVNELGNIAIDVSLLKNQGVEVIELTSGCICCTLQTNLVETLKDIERRFHPTRILIEATGVAEPAEIWVALNHPTLREKMNIMKTITVLDVRLWRAREVIGTLFYNQLRDTDLILLNKIDILEENHVEAFLNEIREVIPGSCIVPTVRCNVDPEIIWARVEGNPTRMGKGDFSNQPKINKEYGQSDHENSCGEYHHQHADSRERGFVAFSFVYDTPLDELLFKHFLEELPWELFRVKGSVQFPDRTALLNHAGRISEWSLWINKPNTRLVFIGWKVDPEKIIRKLKECVLPNCSP